MPVQTRMEYDRRYYLLLFLEAVLVVYVAIKKFFCMIFAATPSHNTWWYDRLDACQEIRQTAEKGQTAFSLNVVYNYQAHRKTHGFDEWLERVWMNMPAAQAVRNRKVIVTDILEAEVRRAARVHPNRPVVAVFLAGGFVETGVEVARRVSQDGIRMRGFVLDISRKALDHAKHHAEERGVGGMFDYIRLNLLDFERVEAYLHHMDVDVLEMIGIVDYLTHDQTVQLLRLAKSSLTPNGLVLSGNILKTCWEAPFLYTVINWPRMHHRNTSEFTEMVNSAGFITDAEDMQIHVEPHKVFAVFEIRNPVSVPALTEEIGQPA